MEGMKVSSLKICHCGEVFNARRYSKVRVRSQGTRIAALELRACPKCGSVRITALDAVVRTSSHFAAVGRL